MPRTAPHSRRLRPTSCSILALATVMAVGATPAAAQSLQGNGTFVTNTGGSANIATGAGTTTVTLNGGQSVIDWTPTDNLTGTGTNINFQNNGTTATFNGATNFAVLNRVLPADTSRAIVMNGTVNSRVAGSQGGSVYFYSPSGFIFGGTSSFSVGSLVVSALPLTLDGSGNFIANFGTGNNVTFGQALNPNATITSGGSIHANIPAFGVGGSAGDSYVALVAPHVVHTGNINVNGSAALVAAEAATISFSTDGLFDIQVTAGSTSPSGLEVTGDITGPAPVDANDQQRVFLVAVPKNQALTMLIANGADLGFALANVASQDDNGVVVLSGGHNIVDGQIAGKSAAAGTGTAGFSFTGAHATNNVVAEATGSAAIYSVSPNLLTTFDKNLTVHSSGTINVSASGVGASVSVAGSLGLSTDRVGAAGQSATAGSINLLALNTGTVSVGGSMSMSADAVGGDASSGTAGGGTGGTINITAGDDSTLDLSGLTTSATGTGGNAIATGVNGGAGTGGSITMTANNGGIINMSSPLFLDVQGSGGSGGGAGAGGNGTGGTARIEVGNNASLTFGSDVELNAAGYGGGSGSGVGGIGHGGTASIGQVLNSNTAGLMTFSGEVALSADGTGGSSNSGTGGAGIGGTANLLSNAHHFVFNNGAWLHANGSGASSISGIGGNGQGGTAEINATGSSEIDAAGTVTIAAIGTGGNGSSGGSGTGGIANLKSQSDVSLPNDVYVNAGAFGGTGFNANGGLSDGGSVHVEASGGGDLTIGHLQTNAWVNGGSSNQLGASSGDSVAGDIFVQAFANSSISIANGLEAYADGRGGETDFHVNGGSGRGGNITVEAFGASAALSVTGSTYLTANGYGGEGGDCFLCGGAGGDGFGGGIFVRANGAAAAVNLGSVDAYARGFGGLGLDFDGGDGTGGTVQFSAIDGGALDVSGHLYGSASGFGGDSTESGYGGDSDMFAGDGVGGTAEILTFGTGTPVIRISDYAQVEANGNGGFGVSGDGGDGFGGTARVRAQNGTIDFSSSLSANADGNGGGAQTGGATSGTGNGGVSTVQAFSNGTLNIDGGLLASADGFGGGTFGFGVNGGSGHGGQALLQTSGANAHATLGSSVDITANGIAGEPCGECGGGGIGGEGVGGQVIVQAFGAATSAMTIAGSVFAEASAQGGDGFTGDAGDGTGGSVFVGANNGADLLLGSDLFAEAEGYGGYSFGPGDGGTGTGGDVTLNATTGGTLDIDGGGYVEADGYGGSAGIVASGDGSDGIGGLAGVYADGGGSIDIGFGVVASADGIGGFSDNAAGGNGLGRTAEIVATNLGVIAIGGSAALSTIGSGGDGMVGGNGTGGGVSDGMGGGTDGAHVFARRASVTIAGNVSLDASGIGGDGGSSFQVSGAGGAGGNGSGGWATIFATNDDLGGSLVDVGNIAISANGTGGDGGTGGGGSLGGTGGAGGNGTGGTLSVTAAAGNGEIQAGDVFATAIAIGGTGGTGGNGDNQAGGTGGNGGNATGGTVAIGTESGPARALASNLGEATYGDITADASAFGGNGGDGNFGASNGNGGNGGNAQDGAALLLVRGSTVNAGNVSLVANATGGGGGLAPGVGPRTGSGGNASVGGDGGVLVLVTERFNSMTNMPMPAQRGTLNAGNITGTAIAIGGAGPGTSTGLSQTLGGNLVIFRNADSGEDDIGSIDFTIRADTIGTGAVEDALSVKNGNVTITDALSFDTDGTLSLFADNGSMTSNSLFLSAANFVPNTVDVTPVVIGTYFADSATITTDNNFLTTADLDIGSSLIIDAPGYIQAHNFTIDGNLDLLANGGDLNANDLDVTGYINLFAAGSINLNEVGAGSYVDIESQGGSTNFANINAGGSVSVVAGGSVSGNDITTGSSIFVQTFGGNVNINHLTSTFSTVTVDSGGDIFLAGDVLADGDIDLSAEGDILMQNASTHQSIDIDGGGYVDGDDLTAGDSIDVAAGQSVTLGNLSAGLVNPSFNSDAEYNVGILAGGAISTGNIEAAQSIGLATPGTITTGDIDAGDIFMALGTGNMNFGDASAGSEIYLADYSMMSLGGTITGGFDPAPILAAVPIRTSGSINIGDVSANKFTAAAGVNLSTGIIDSGTGIDIGAGGAINTGDLFAGDFVLANGGSITTGNIDADSVNMTSTSGNITTGDVFAFGAVEMAAFGDILTGDILAGSIDLLAGDDITTGDLSTQQISQLAQEGGGGEQFLFPGASITLEAGGDISTGDIASIDGVYADAGGALSTGDIDANDFVELYSVANMQTGAITAGSYLYAESGANMALGVLLAGTDIGLDAIGSATFTSAQAGTIFDFSVGSLFGGNVIAGNEISGEAAGAVTLGSLTAGLPIEEDFSVGIIAGGNINVGNVNATGPAGFATLTNLTTGNITAGEGLLALVGGNVTTGAITTSGEGGGQVYIGDDSMFFAAGGTADGIGDFDPTIVLALDPVATGGSITINGPVNTGLFRAAAGTGLTTQAITAGGIEASAGGLATINGIWNSAEQVTLRSNDIDIASTGRIDAGGLITLISSNGTQAQIGDGLTGTGYALSNAEFGRISGDEVAIVGRGDASAAIDMLIGDLNVTGPLAGSTIEGANSALVFAVGNIQTQDPGGVIRVAGDISATGFGSGNSIEFYADRFELDAANGSIGVVSSGTNLSGEIGLYADRIHVASATILDKLAANPLYSGYQQDLNRAATVQRPEGVLRSSSLWIESDNLQDILIQNTGTAATPAGFLFNVSYINDDSEVAGPPGSINLVVNGQVVTEGGTLTGIEARDALTEGQDLSPFTANSTINGCPLTGPCVIRPEVPDVVDERIDLIVFDPLGDSDFGNEPDIDDNEEGDEGANNPIVPPQPLFDTRPLIPASDVNDPVSGTGNPSLLGGECTPDDENQCPTDKEAGQ